MFSFMESPANCNSTLSKFSICHFYFAKNCYMNADSVRFKHRFAIVRASYVTFIRLTDIF